jgi:ABC-type polysaccharide/polyol phosphate export permease
VVSVLLTFWFWMTPIFITEQQVPQRLRFLLRINPLAFVVTDSRYTAGVANLRAKVAVERL